MKEWTAGEVLKYCNEIGIELSQKTLEAAMEKQKYDCAKKSMEEAIKLLSKKS